MRSFIKWFNSTKGYGFIEFRENENIYVHYTSLLKDKYKSFIKSEVIRFELIKVKNGYITKEVQSIPVEVT